jgi:hypothetical protein
MRAQCGVLNFCSKFHPLERSEYNLQGRALNSYDGAASALACHHKRESEKTGAEKWLLRNLHLC